MKQPINPHLKVRLEEIKAENKLEEKKLLKKINAIKASLQKCKRKV